MPSSIQPRATIGAPAASDTPAPSDLVHQAMIERAKTVVIVARRVDEDTAAQILLDAATEAGVPVRLAADQVMSALQTGGGQEEITQDTLAHAIDAIQPVPLPPVTTHSWTRGRIEHSDERAA